MLANQKISSDIVTTTGKREEIISGRSWRACGFITFCTLNTSSCVAHTVFNEQLSTSGFIFISRGQATKSLRWTNPGGSLSHKFFLGGKFRDHTISTKTCPDDNLTTVHLSMEKSMSAKKPELTRAL